MKRCQKILLLSAVLVLAFGLSAAAQGNSAQASSRHSAARAFTRRTA